MAKGERRMRCRMAKGEWRMANRRMKIFKVARIGTRDVTIEEAQDGRAACFKAGWAPEWCEWMDITRDVEQLEMANGE